MWAADDPATRSSHASQHTTRTSQSSGPCHFSNPSVPAARRNFQDFSLQRSFSEFFNWFVSPYTPRDESDEDEDEDEAEESQPGIPKKQMKSDDRSLLERVVDSNGFEVVSMIAIMLCMFFLGAEAACNRNCSAGEQMFYMIMENIFIALFLVEWCLRFAKDGWKFFDTFEHCFDTFIVWVSGVILGWIVPLAAPQAMEQSPAFQSLNVLRSMRSLRFISFIKNYETFKLLLAGILGTANTLLACCVLLIATDFLFGVVAVDLIGDFDGWGIAPKGSVPWNFQQGLLRSCLYMTRLIFCDGGVFMVEELIVKQPWIALFCFSYTALSSYVILNLVTAVILEKATEMSQDNAEERARELQAQEKQRLKELKQLFLDLDGDGSGQVTMDEFDEAFQTPEYRHKFLMLGFDEGEAKMLFKVLDTDEEGELSVSEFTQGMREVKGEATSKSLLYARKKAEKLEKMLLKSMPQEESETGLMDREAILEEAAPEEIGQRLDTQITALESAANSRLDEIERACKNALHVAHNFEEVIRRLKQKSSTQGTALLKR